LGGEVAEDQDRGVAELLELSELAEHDRESEVDVGRRRVDAQLDAERCAALELARQVGFGDEIDRAGADHAQLLGRVAVHIRANLARSARWAGPLPHRVNGPSCG